jgi:hypothetical protein
MMTNNASSADDTGRNRQPASLFGYSVLRRSLPAFAGVAKHHAGFAKLTWIGQGLVGLGSFGLAVLEPAGYRGAGASHFSSTAAPKMGPKQDGADFRRRRPVYSC